MDLKQKILKRMTGQEELPKLAINQQQELAPKSADLPLLKMGQNAQLPQIDNPVQMIDGLKDQVAGSRDAALKAFGEQTDLSKAATGIADEAYQNVARTAADLVLPDISDAGGAVFGKIQKIDKLRKLGKEGAVVANIVKAAEAAKDESKLAKSGEKLFELHHTRPGAGLEGKAVFNKSSELGAVYDPKMNILNGENLLAKKGDITDPLRFGKVLDPKGNVINGKNLLNPAKKLPETKVAFKQVSGADVTKRLESMRDELLKEKQKIKAVAKNATEAANMYDSHKQAVIAKIKRDLAGENDNK